MALSFWNKRSLIRESSLPVTLKWLLTILADYSGDDEWAFPNQATIARDLCCHQRHAKRLLKQLRDDGLIEVKQRRGRRSNQYRILWKCLGGIQTPSPDKSEGTSTPPTGDTQTPSTGDTQTPSMGTHRPPGTPNEHPKRTSKEHKSEKNQKQADEIFQAYPRKVGKKPALKAIEKALNKTSFDELLSAVQEYAKFRSGEDPKFTPYPATWFNAERWNDDRKEWQSSGRPGKRVVGPGELYDPNHTATL